MRSNSTPPEPPADPLEPVPTVPSVTADPSTLRQQLQAAAPGLAPMMLDTLAEAMQAKKRVRVESACPKCGCAHARHIEVNDAAAATNAVKAFLEAVEGRPGVFAGAQAEPLLIVRRVGLDRS